MKVSSNYSCTAECIVLISQYTSSSFSISSIVFAHKAIAHLISDLRSIAVATGLGDKLGNKGGISISFKVADSSFCFVNAHLAAHQHAAIRRTNEFRRISNHIVAGLLHQKRSSEVSESTSSDEECTTGCDQDEDVLPQYSSDDLRTDSGPQLNPLIDVFDKVFWFGDLNFRVYGTREVVDGMLESHMHDALLCNDQLTMLMKFNRVFCGFSEGPLNFFPTYKFDHDSGKVLLLFALQFAVECAVNLTFYLLLLLM